MFRIINYNKSCSFGAVLDEGFNGDPFVKLPWEQSARVKNSAKGFRGCRMLLWEFSYLPPTNP